MNYLWNAIFICWYQLEMEGDGKIWESAGTNHNGKGWNKPKGPQCYLDRTVFIFQRDALASVVERYTPTRAWHQASSKLVGKRYNDKPSLFLTSFLGSKLLLTEKDNGTVMWRTKWRHNGLHIPPPPRDFWGLACELVWLSVEICCLLRSTRFESGIIPSTLAHNLLPDPIQDVGIDL